MSASDVRLEESWKKALGDKPVLDWRTRLIASYDVEDAPAEEGGNDAGGVESGKLPAIRLRYGPSEASSTG
ncbi:MAG: hypothetical protein H5U22_15545 [Rhizobium sp.]|nr:hypothetical protein [Rhizobium sp.]